MIKMEINKEFKTMSIMLILSAVSMFLSLAGLQYIVAPEWACFGSIGIGTSVAFGYYIKSCWADFQKVKKLPSS